MAQIMVQYGRSSRRSRKESVRSPFGKSILGKVIRKVVLKYGWEKVPKLECLFVNREKRIFLSVYVEDIELTGKKQNINPTWKIFMKEVDLREPTSFLHHVYLGCTQRECQISEDIVDNYKSMFGSRISAGRNEKLPEHKVSGTPETYTGSSYSYDMEGTQRNAWKYTANWSTKLRSNYTRSCLDDHQFKEEEIGSVGEFAKI